MSPNLILDGVEAWPVKKATDLVSTAFACSEHAKYRHRYDPDNCAGCALQKPWEGSGYAGWLRIIIETNRMVPLMYAIEELKDAKVRNTHYYNAILRDLVTFGCNWKDFHGTDHVCKVCGVQL